MDYELRSASTRTVWIAPHPRRCRPQAPCISPAARVLAERQSHRIRRSGAHVKPGRRAAARERERSRASWLPRGIDHHRQGGRPRSARPALVALASARRAVFDQFTLRQLPQDHPLHGGFDAAPHLEAADRAGGRVRRALVPGSRTRVPKRASCTGRRSALLPRSIRGFPTTSRLRNGAACPPGPRGAVPVAPTGGGRGAPVALGRRARELRGGGAKRRAPSSRYSMDMLVSRCVGDLGTTRPRGHE